MKQIIFFLAICITLISCHKKKEDPKPDLEYADSLVGTFVGLEKYYDSDNSTVLYSNSSKSIVVTKTSKNVIKCTGFNNGANLSFSTSDAGSGDVNLASLASYIVSYGPGWNKYTSSNRTLTIYVKETGTNTYQYFSGVKQ